MNPAKISYTKAKKKRNMWVFDAGLHTQHMTMKPGETDVEFVNRFLLGYFKGCRNRGGKAYRDYLMRHDCGDDYVTVWGVK